MSEPLARDYSASTKRPGLAIALQVLLPAIAFVVLGIVASACGDAEEENLHEGSSAPATTPVPPASTSIPAVSPVAPETLSGTAVNTLLTPDGETVSQDITSLGAEKWSWGVAPVFSPDGRAFAARNAGDLIVGSSDGTAVRVIQVGRNSAIWSPDSKTLAVADPLPRGPEQDRRSAIALVSSDGSSRIEVATTDRPGVMQFLNDGRLAYTLGGSVRIYDPLAGSESMIEGVQIDSNESNWLPFLFSPDGRFLAVLAGSKLAVVDVDTGEMTELTDQVNFFGAAPYGWSLDSRLLFFSDRDEAKVARIATFAVESGKVSALIEASRAGTYGGMALTPQGGWLVYAHYGAGSGGEESASYEAMNIFTGELRVLFKWGIGLALSPDGYRLSFARTVGDSASIGAWVAALDY